MPANDILVANWLPCAASTDSAPASLPPYRPAVRLEISSLPLSSLTAAATSSAFRPRTTSLPTFRVPLTLGPINADKLIESSAGAAGAAGLDSSFLPSAGGLAGAAATGGTSLSRSSFGDVGAEVELAAFQHGVDLAGGLVFEQVHVQAANHRNLQIALGQAWIRDVHVAPQSGQAATALQQVQGQRRSEIQLDHAFAVLGRRSWRPGR
ncbi:hypothetical protein G6F22_015214 [Rhizopus arrhizus]|nr:hypothetical protein G6F22_015214 [Rhizopus arrhizus]